jgi:malate dehydrogenase
VLPARDVLAHRDAAHEIVMVDIKPGIAEGKALDIWQSAPIDRFNSKPTESPTITSRQPIRKWSLTTSTASEPGMSCDDLIETNTPS